MPTAPGPRATCRVGGTRAGGVARSATGGGANTSTPCHCEGVRSTLKTLAYDCGNPVQYVCGHSPAVLFYLLDRHASLAMTKGSKYPSPHFLCHSRARGPRKYECICGVDKAGIGSIKLCHGLQINKNTTQSYSPN